jgi:hypothetical protein
MLAATSRNFATRMNTTPRLTAGAYFVDVTFECRANESAMNETLRTRLGEEAARYGGVLSSATTAFPNPGLARLVSAFAFLNRGQAIAFAQNAGLPHESRGVVFVPDHAALAALP